METTKTSGDEDTALKSKQNSRWKKRKRRSSDSSSSSEDMLPDNMLLLENKVHSTAIKNNLDDSSVRKLLKKVVTNDRVLALVKRQEQNENTKDKEDKSVGLKLTRSKVKELMKVSPKTAWNLENIALSPINHIPVKTRPEVKALIAQELPEDEDDEEYEPTHDESDEDHMLESCSDIDSQPRTPATPKNQRGGSPKVVTDGPFKVPQEITATAKRKLELEEEATIALRTRSKLSLSSTSIEHIESNFVPPDDIPCPDTDDLWNQFLEECLNPATTSKNEDDDETDPEYNVAADPDALEEDEEVLGNSIIKISKKELNDLVTELFHIMPEATCNDDLAENLAHTVLTDNSQTEISHWEGKQEPVSDDQGKKSITERITFEKTSYTRLSIGKSEPDDVQDQTDTDDLLIPRSIEPFQEQNGIQSASKTIKKEIHQMKDKRNKETDAVKEKVLARINKVTESQKVVDKTVKMTIIEGEGRTPLIADVAEPPVIAKMAAESTEEIMHSLKIELGSDEAITQEQILIMQQQLRQHIQVATTNFLQLFIHPQHWSYAPNYKKYLATFVDLANSNPKSVVNVCNLQPAMDLVTSWEKTVAEDTPENARLVKFVLGELEKNRRNAAHNHLYVGDFPELFKEVVANSSVFLYPHLLPPIPYRADNPLRRNIYLQSEDALIALGLSQFCEYVEANPEIFKPHAGNMRSRSLFNHTIQLLQKYMLPWMTPKKLHSHIAHVKKVGLKSNPINKFLKNRELVPVEHKLIPYDPTNTIYDLAEHELPPIWLKYLSKHSKRFGRYMRQNKRVIKEPEGIPVSMNHTNAQRKEPLPEDFTKVITRTKHFIEEEKLPYKLDIYINANVDKQPEAVLNEKDDVIHLPDNNVENTQTDTLPLMSQCVNEVAVVNPQNNPKCSSSIKSGDGTCCSCCLLLRKICQRQRTILEYFRRGKKKNCFCSDIEYPSISNKLKLFLSIYRNNHNTDLSDIEAGLRALRKKKYMTDSILPEVNDLEELVYVMSYQARLIQRTTTYKDVRLKSRVNRLFSKYNFQKTPVVLAMEFCDICGTDLIDLYLDFMGFLTPEQADSLGMFKHHFTSVCVKNLIKKVKEQVKRVEHLRCILSSIRQVYFDNESSACQTCTRLIAATRGYPQLAEYVFKLFPHRKESRSKQPDNVQTQSQPPDNVKKKDSNLTNNEEINSCCVEANMDTQEDCLARSNIPVNPQSQPHDSTKKMHDNITSIKGVSVSYIETDMDVQEDSLASSHQPQLASMPDALVTIPDKEIIDSTTTKEPMESSQISSRFTYEADDSYSDEDTNHVKSIVNTGAQARHLTINPLRISINMDDNTDCNSNTSEEEQKPDTKEYDPEFSMVIVCEEEVKSEPTEWKRDEDKQILEVLKQFLSPQEKKNKTIDEIINENNIFELLAETLLHKSKEDVKERVLYLLNVLLSEDLSCK